MKKRWLLKTTGICLVLLFIVGVVWAAKRPLKVKMGSGKAEVTYLKGKAHVVKKNKARGRALAKGTLLSQGTRVQTEKGARMELKLPDGSFLRFDENTNFELAALGVKRNKDRSKRRRNVRVNMALGKTWAKVSKKYKGRGQFALATKTAVAGVRATTYRMNVKEDDSVMIKVYWGEILVENQKRAEAGLAPPMPSKDPKPVLGPKPVAGPRAVTMEEWTYIVGSLQQINIGPDGKVQKPFRFDIMADLNDWVNWNKARDEKIVE